MDQEPPPTMEEGVDYHCATVEGHGQKNSPSDKAKNHIPCKKMIYSRADGKRIWCQKIILIKRL